MADQDHSGERLSVWLFAQADRITTTLQRLPAGMAPQTMATNIIAALMSAAVTDPPKEMP